MNAIYFLKNLQKRTSDYKYAEQAIDYASALKQLSEGIYTEEERFVYELLQNAVDAYIDTNSSELIIKIAIVDDTLCFMHNGAPFSEKDIEGLCGVGRSYKASSEYESNKKKVGYKGIGFKSVFMKSVEYVCVSSGEYCFLFDKHTCLDVMPKYENIVLSEDDIPWQVIPIPCDAPTGFDISDFNVATYIKTSAIDVLLPKIHSLLKNPQFLLFLNADNITIELYNHDNCVISAGRNISNGEVRLLSNNEVVSNWLVHTTDPIPVKDSIRENLIKDFNTPGKLKTATDFEISFAIKIDGNGNIEKVDDSVVYTFLPTSYNNLGVPFLINANFITDAGRQQLHQHSEWNRLIFASIPNYFFKWIPVLSAKHHDYYKILPSKNPKSFDELTGIYTDSFQSALDNIAFIPSRKNNIFLKVKEAINDSIDFASISGINALTRHINKEYSYSFTQNSFFDCKDCRRFDEYGVFCFNTDKCKPYFDDPDTIGTITANQCKDLIDFFVKLTEESDSKDHIMSTLKECKFVVCEDNTVSEPSECYFPTEYSSESNTYVPLIHPTVFSYIKTKDLIDWFKNLGVEYMSISNYLKDVYCRHNYKIKVDNAVEIGKIVYDVFIKGALDGIPEKFIKRLKFLSTKGELYYADELYLSHIYHPQVDFEELVNEDMFVSEKYAEYGDINIWKSVFLRLGMSENVDLTKRRYNNKIKSICTIQDNHASEIVAIEEAFSSLPTYFKMYGYELEYYPIALNCTDNKILTRLFSKIFKSVYKKEDESCYLYYRWDVEEHINIREDFLIKRNKDFSFREFLLKYCQLYPTTSGDALYANEIFLNTEINASLCEKYLPILNISNQLSDDWTSILPFKRDLLLNDLLELLDSIADDPEKDNNERISAIYKRIIELGQHNNPAIKEWGKNHKILSAKNGQYLLPKELSYITVDGFKDKCKAYIGKHDKSNREGLLQLLLNLGVNVITNEMITPLFKNEVRSSELKNLLLKKIDYISLLKEDITDQYSYNQTQQDILSKISRCNFYQCDEITLTYGDKNDTIKKKTFTRDNSVYYVGSLKPTRIEPLISPLMKCLSLKNVADELLIILITNDKSELVDYLKDKGYSTEYIPVSSKDESREMSQELAPGNSEGNTTSDDDENGDSTNAKTQPHSGCDTDQANNSNEQNKKYLHEYSEKVKEYMGADFSMPSEKVKSEHIIVRYRILMYIKQHSNEYKIKSSFDEKEFIRKDGYTAIPLENGKLINAQGARFGIWYLSPTVWEDIIDRGNYACLCIGNTEDDFMIIKNEDDIKDIAESTKNVLMKMTPTSSMDIMATIKSVMESKITMIGEEFGIKTVYSDRDVHLMLLVHKTPEPVLNSIFDDVFKSEGSMTL